MNKQLLLELEAYIENNRLDDLFFRETVTYNYIMPMKSAYKKEDKKREAKEVNEEAQDDKAWLVRFRKNSLSEDDYGLISKENEIEQYISKEKSEETFSIKLLQHIDRLGLKDAEIYKKAGIDRRHFSKIRCDVNYKPKKSTAIALCIALELNLKESIELLQLAGYSLSNCDIGDLVIKFFIERKIYDLTIVNEALDYYGQKMVGVVG
ncbi:hypothetical protein [Herbinix luporum]|jgi:hypothetical protein|uniref:Uncharacterized protein n=1 Tax=Herbinix luporum TaxID=1679721 RepID=A0A0K8J2F3_9FIRM|nr:hypothetical protein [Herbinix luporum]MDI9489383.1 hypothetical protein [Bacillota bacterium]CUH91831.1 hypothetical protein SD1D_0278 [Herbinix luporum]HHT57411.1 hypothetical protein [Herbinix luporum]